MDWNLKTITQWDWESLALNFGGKESDVPKSEQESQWRVEGDGSISNGSVYSSEAGAHSGCEFGNGCSPKSSISASTDSSSMTRIKISEFDFQAAHLSFQKPSMKKEFAMVTANDTSPVVVSTAGHGEHMIGLKLGKRTYFEDVCHGSNIFSSSSSSSSSSLSSSSSSLTSVISSATLSKKSKVSLHRTHTSFCQVEGCNTDLSAAKEYHRKHRVCESHSKCPKVIVDGHERRFCQQCSRFHELSEFDQKKRSCRRRLSDHNARRRKPQSDFISFNSGRFTPFSDDRYHTNLILNKACPTMNSMWDASWDFNLMQTKGSRIKSTKTGAFNGGQQFPSFTLQNTSSTLNNDVDRVLSFKGSPAEALNQGLEALDVASNLDGAPELRRALSLLSTDSWDTYERCPNSLASLADKNTAAAADLPAIQTLSNTTKLWQDEEVPLIQQAVMTPVFNLQGNGSQFQLVRASYDSEKAFCDSSRIY